MTFARSSETSSGTDTSGVSVLDITQATSARFTDVYFRQTVLYFIERGRKPVSGPVRGDVVAEAGDLMIFPPGVMVTMENRALIDRSYRAVGVSYSRDLAENVYPHGLQTNEPPTVRVLRCAEHAPGHILQLLRGTLAVEDLPPAIRGSRLLEPLVWLKGMQIEMPTQGEDSPVRRPQAHRVLPRYRIRSRRADRLRLVALVRLQCSGGCHLAAWARKNETFPENKALTERKHPAGSANHSS